MADAHGGATALGSNGAVSLAASRAATLSALEELGSGTPPPAVPVEPDPAAETEPDDESEAEAAGSDDAEPEAEADESEPDDDEAEPESEDEAKPDPDVTKRLAQVQKAERRARESIQREKAEALAEIQKRDADVADKFKAAAAFEKLKARAAYDMTAIARELGVDPKDFGALARAFYAESPEGSADPKNKGAADRVMKDRQLEQRLAEAERRAEELDKRWAERESQANVQREAQEYLAGLKTAASPKAAPRVAALLASSPGEAEMDLAELAIMMSQRTGVTPSQADVVKAYEAKLTRLGVAAPAAKVAPKAETKVDAKGKPAAKVAPKANGVLTPKDREAQRLRTLQKLESGDLTLDD